MRAPHALSATFATAMYDLKVNLDRAKLPGTAAREFFQELADERFCVCGTEIDADLREKIRTRAANYLGNDEVGFLNTMKGEIDDAVASSRETPAEGLTADIATLATKVSSERDAHNVLDALRLAAERADPAVKAAREEIERLGKLLAELDDRLERFDEKDNQQTNDNTFGIEVMEKRLAVAEDKFARASETLELRQRRDVLARLLSRAHRLARDGVMAEVCADANGRISELLPDNDIRIDRIERCLVLDGQEGGSVGETLSIAYAFLATLFDRSGRRSTRAEAADLLERHLGAFLPQREAAEYGRYMALCIDVAVLREDLQVALESERRQLPKVSLKQILSVAERIFSREVERAARSRPPEPDGASVADLERSIHQLSGYANEVMFAVLRALNEASVGLAARCLQRPDALAKATGPFRRMTSLASQLNGLEHVLDAASFGELSVTRHDAGRKLFELDFVDVRLATIRQLAIRRRLIHVATGHREPRFVREQLKRIQQAFLKDAVETYMDRVGVRAAGEIDLTSLERRGDALLNAIDAEDDLLFVSGGGGPRIPILYHMSMALRWTSMAGDLVARSLPGRARRDFDDEVRLDYLLDGLPRGEERVAARSAWDDLTVTLPARTHFELLRRPFMRTGAAAARPIRSADMGAWSTVVREIANGGGDVGRRFGEVWEEFSARGFDGSAWEMPARNVAIRDGGRKITEVDLLLLRDDLLLVVELKGLTGSGLRPYDHWKSRMVIEKGCRQALLAADTLRNRPQLLASIVGARAAFRIEVIQPIVLCSEAMFDGWSHQGVPVAGETVRKAITVGSRVEFYDPRTLDVVRTEEHLRADDLTTETILRAIREPIELSIAPEQGAVHKLPVAVGGAVFLIPALAPAPA